MPANCGDPRECYPFPQFLEPDLVESIVRSGAIRWFVVELGHTIIGTCGAVVNIGTKDDRVGNCLVWSLMKGGAFNILVLSFSGVFTILDWH